MKERLGNMLTRKKIVQASTKLKVTLAFVALFLLTLPLLTIASSEIDSSAHTIEAIQGQISEQAQQISFANSAYTGIDSQDTTDVALLEESYAPEEEDVALMPPHSLEAMEASQGYIGIAPLNTVAAELTKVLRTPANEPAPDLNFTFRVERYAFLNSAGATGALTNLPPIGEMDGNVGTLVLNINEANGNPTTVGNTRTLTRQLDVLAGITFNTAGTYVWHISEVGGSSGLTGRFNVDYSEARYELRVEVTGTATLTAVAHIVAIVPDQEGLAGGSPMYSWGGNASGQLGHGTTTNENRYRRVMYARESATATPTVRTDWVKASSFAGGSIALNAEGGLYVWGGPRSAAMMGRGGTGTGNITIPERLTIADAGSDRWIDADGGGSGVAGAFPADGYMIAINDAGEMWSWGINAVGQLGLGNTTTFSTPQRILMPGVSLENQPRWAQINVVSISGTSVDLRRSFALAITEDGHLYSWGNNTFSQLGRTPGGTSPANRPGRVNNPAGVPASFRWEMARPAGVGTAFAIGNDGQIYSWGTNADRGAATWGNTVGILGRPGGNTTIPTLTVANAPDSPATHVSPPVTRWVDVVQQVNLPRVTVALSECGRLFSWAPGTTTVTGLGRPGGGATSATRNDRPVQIGTANNWVAIGGGNTHTVAMTSTGRLYAWGANAAGQLGQGDFATHPNSPQFVMQTFGLQGFSQTGSGTSSFALVQTDPMTFTNIYTVTHPNPVTARADLTKALQQPADQTTSNLSFDFNIERYSFNGSMAPDQVNQVPQLGTSVVSGVGRVSIGMNHSSTTVETSGAVSTLLRSIDILDGVEFDTPGVYVWRISEVEGSSGATHPSFVVYSRAEYKLTVTVTEVARTLFITTVIEEVTPDNGFELSSAAQRDSFPLYSWGNNASGRLARTVTTESPNDLPARATHSENWVYVAGSATAAYAINTNGELFSWGAPWSEYQMGQGGVNLGIPPSTPAQVGDADDWTQVSARTGQASAINENGELFRWGQGGFNVPTPVEVGTTFASVAQGGTRILAICSDGYLFRSTTAAATDITLEQVGTRNDWSAISARSDSAFPFFPTWQGVTESGQLWDIPLTGTETQVGTATNWVDVRTTNMSSAAITTAGHLYTWGVAAELGRPNDGTGGPGRVGTDNNWVSVHGGNNYFLAFNALGELWAWGSNFSGQLGLGDDTHRDEPELVDRVSAFSAASRGGGTTSFMLMSFDTHMVFTNTYGIAEPTPFSANLTKALEQVAGQTTSNLSFDFEIRRHSFNGNTGQASQLPQLGSSVVGGHGRETIAMNTPGVTVETVGGVSILRQTVDLLDGVVFDAPGVYVWRIAEVAGSSGATPPSTVNYSQALYELRVEVTHWAGPGSPLRTEATIHRIQDDAGNDVSDPIVSGFPMMSWGDNGGGRLGRGTSGGTMLPGQVGTEENWMQAVTASGGSFAVNSRGELFGWGVNASANNMGQGGAATTLPHLALTVPTRIGARTDWVQVSARSTHVVALTETGAIYMWGNPATGSGVTSYIPQLAEPTRIAPHIVGAYVMTTAHNVYVIDTQGRLFSKGSNRGGLGEDISPATGRSELEQVGVRTDWASISGGPLQGGHNTAAAITTGGELFTWGAGGPELGQGDNNPRPEPTQVGTDSHWSQVTLTSGPVAGIALTTDGRLFSWGNTEHGQLGREVTALNPGDVPGQIGTASNWRTVASANSHVLAFNADGELWGWGRNDMRQLGIDGTADRTSPELVLHAEDFSAVSYGGGQHTIMLFRTEPIPMVFTNTHTRTTSLEVSKEIVGDRANLTQLFTFDIRLDPSALCSADTTFTARVYTGPTFSHEVTFSASTTSSVDLLDNQRLVFGTINTGTSFNVYERAVSGFTPSVGIWEAGTHVTTLTAPNPNMALGTDTRVTGEGRNSANFINTYHFVPVTGIESTSLNLLITVIAVLAVLGTALGTRHALQGEGVNIAQSLSNIRASNLTLPKLAQVSLPKLNQVSLPKIPSAVTKAAKTTLKRVETLLFRNIGK